MNPGLGKTLMASVQLYLFAILIVCIYHDKLSHEQMITAGAKSPESLTSEISNLKIRILFLVSNPMIERPQEISNSSIFTEGN